MKKYLPLTLVAALFFVSCETNPPTASDDSTPQFGKAFISSNVFDAEIWLDNLNTGKHTPDTIETTVGTHTFTLKKSDYIDASRSVEIIKDSLTIYNITMTPLSEAGRIYITSNADGAQIFLDQENTGKLTPDTVYTSPGTHQIELRRAFYYSISQQVEVFQDSLVSLNFMLQEEPSSKVVLIEDFANVSCVPCVTSNRIIENLTSATYGYSKLVAIKYPTNFPSPSDPFYLANTTDCDSRISYYNIFFAPTTIVDGVERPISTDSLSIMAAIDQRLNKSLQFRIDISTTAIGSEFFITVTLQVIDAAGIDFSNSVLHTVVTETDIEFSTPPGSNGETKFYDVMRVMLPSNVGLSLSGISQTEEVEFQYQTEIKSNWIVENLHVVAFIQNSATKEVFQTGSTF